MQFALLCLLYVEHKMFVNSRSHKKGKSETRLPEIGGDGGIRTLDLTDANRTLSQLSYAPIFD